LPTAAGKTFFKKKKQPIPVNLGAKDWSAQVRKACDATYMYPSSGSSLNIRCVLTCSSRLCVSASRRVLCCMCCRIASC